MEWTDRLSLFSPLDYWAVGLLFGGWMVIGYFIENPPKSRPSVSVLMAQYRRDWMVQMITRQPRIFDAQILATLRQGTSFFASATMIAIGGCLALFGNMERFIGVAEDLTMGADPNIVWEVKILVLLVFLANGFLKFVWSNRLFGYCAVLMAAVPNEPENALCAKRAAKAGEINITAARSFNRGLRSVYFALASTVWLLGAEVLIAAAAFTCLVLLRREFASQSRAVLIQDE
ncbi:MAG: DUF599 domain-containing protein [Pseudomonadota bacterium]|uniref:DUF599 domain-containing protein n=1 Tax=Roseovarius TaxID=74030 RepID=UPI0022A81728|nr:DUF599 domain-containing protein [Roseovarius sp. EGI FJ00037]MCZ0813816.1 DUF599 domain-containing protein [Roseovarius sp. EGI FJ00037]